MDIDIPWFEENVLLHKLHADERRLLLKAFEVREYAAGEEIVTQGSPAGGIQILYSGTATISFRMPEMTVYLDEAGEGALFGEMTFLSGGNATATVTANGHCVAYRMDSHGYYQLIAENKDMLIGLFTYMLSRATDSIQHMNQEQLRILQRRARAA